MSSNTMADENQLRTSVKIYKRPVNMVSIYTQYSFNPTKEKQFLKDSPEQFVDEYKKQKKQR